MKKTFRLTKISFVLLGIILVLSITTGSLLQAALFGNYSCLAFSPNTATSTSQNKGLSVPLSEDPCDVGVTGTSSSSLMTSSTRPTLGYLISAGGGQFLKAAGNFNLFLSKFEFSEITGPDFKMLLTHLNTTINSLEKAYSTYNRLKKLAESTPYNQSVISALIYFDYESYQKKHNLISSIFLDVQAYLGNGDVRGIYQEFHSKTGQILDSLYELRKIITYGNLPELSNLWRINEQFSAFKIFSQYVAEVFFSL